MIHALGPANLNLQLSYLVKKFMNEELFLRNYELLSTIKSNSNFNFWWDNCTIRALCVLGFPVLVLITSNLHSVLAFKIYKYPSSSNILGPDSVRNLLDA